MCIKGKNIPKRKELVTQMGMSAAQARLLSITARLTDNEMRSQLITNSKLRLADKSSEASSEYMKALNSTSLTYATYNSNGDKTYQSLTPGLIMTYGELKTQYGLINSSGQILVSGIDQQNYETSKTLTEFLLKYDVPFTDNPKYAEALDQIYSDEAGRLHDEDDAFKWDKYLTDLTGDNIQNINNLLKKDAKDFTEADFNTIYGYVNNWKSSVTTVAGGMLKNYPDMEGIFGDYVNELLSPPGLTYPDSGDESFYDTTITGNSDLANKFISASNPCWQAAKAGSSGVGCFLHVLAHLMNLKKSDINASGDVDSSWERNETTTTGHNIHVPSGINGGINGSSINGSSMTDDMAEVSEYIWDPNNNCMAPEDPSDTTTYESSEAEKLLSNYKWVDSNGDGTYEKTLKTFPERIIDMYYAVQNYTSLGINYNDLIAKVEEFQEDMATELSKEVTFNEERYHTAVEQVKNQLQTWIDTVADFQLNYHTALEELPPKELPDENDPKYAWYKNLWYRMGGISENQKEDNSNNYKVLDSNLMYNAEWIQFALEHGIISMEQVIFSENGSKDYPNIGNCDWVSIQYNNASDISSAQNDAAIAKAEAKYKNALTEIEQEDKKFDQDLKKLDTEHNALQTEYDSVKSVIDKNVERSFKAFS